MVTCQALAIRKIVYQNGKFYRGERSCAVPFGHVTEGVKPLPYNSYFSIKYPDVGVIPLVICQVNFIVGNGLVPFRYAVPFGHVMEGVKPLPYNSYLPSNTQI